MLRRIARNFFIVNKHSEAEFQKASSIPFCAQPEFASLAATKPLPCGPEFFKKIENEPAFESYRDIAPFGLFNAINPLHTLLVVKGNYMPEVKTIEFVCMDTNGLCLQYIDLEYLVPVRWEEYLNCSPFNFPPSREIDTDMVFKNIKTMAFFLFSKKCQWDQAGIEHPDFDFRKLFKEAEWLDDAISQN